MKNFLPALLPALALLTLGGCAGTSALTSTETDGVYYSSQDKTTRVASASTSVAPAEESYEATTDEAANPDYNGGSSTARAGSTEYYDEDYGYSTRIRRFHQPYRGTGLGYYDLAYTDPFWYGGGGFSPYSNFYDPFYSPYGFGSPYAFGGGSFINIGFGNPWARPWRYGYGGGYGLGYYDGFNNGYYNGLGGYGYGRPSSYYGNSYNRAYSGTDNRRNVNVAPRRDRSSQAYNLDQPATGANTTTSTRSRSGNVVNGSAGSATPASAPISRGRGRILSSSSPDATSPQPTTAPSQPELTTGAATAQPRRWRSVEPARTTPSSTEPQQEVARPSRRIIRSEPSQQVARPQRSESYEQPTRSYSQPSRSYDSSPSMSSPSNSGGSSGGGRGRIR